MLVEVMQLTPENRIWDPAVGNGGFLFTAYNCVLGKFERELDRDQKSAMQLVEGIDLTQGRATLEALGRQSGLAPSVVEAQPPPPAAVLHI